MNYIECSTGHEKDIECETIVSRPAIVAKCRMHINEGNFTGQKNNGQPRKEPAGEADSFIGIRNFDQRSID